MTGGEEDEVGKVRAEDEIKAKKGNVRNTFRKELRQTLDSQGGLYEWTTTANVISETGS